MLLETQTHLQTILSILTILVLAIATFTDIKSREVPDWLSYGFLFSVLGIRSIFTFEQGISVLWSGFLGMFFFFLIGLLLYKTNQWGGADSKLLMGLGGVLGITLPLQSSSLNLLWFFLLLLFVGAIFGLLWMSFLAVRKIPAVIVICKEKLLYWKYLHFSAAGTSVIFLSLTIFVHYLFIPFIVIPLAVFYLFIFITAVEKTCFYRRVLPQDIAEGDWLAEAVQIKEKITLRKKALEMKDIHLLQKLMPQKKVLIKDGVPFVPSFLIAFLLFVWVTVQKVNMWNLLW
ncbi:prepilin peptidase [Candidatus Woesearchaeota archaeon]|nr:prepilin peptidase [Candidatus Woesearchaeota archaeon]